MHVKTQAVQILTGVQPLPKISANAKIYSLLKRDTVFHNATISSTLQLQKINLVNNEVKTSNHKTYRLKA